MQDKNRFYETMQCQANHIAGDEEVAVYSYANNSWAAAYKQISISAKIFTDTKFTDTKFYDWFGINYIKS